MKIKVQFVVDLSDEQVEILCYAAQARGYAHNDPSKRELLKRFFADNGLNLLYKMSELTAEMEDRPR